MKRRLPASAKIWTRRAVLLLETGMLLFWLGIALQNDRFIITSAILFTYLILALMVSSGPSKGVSLQRNLSVERTLEEHPFQVSTKITNESTTSSLIQVMEGFPVSLDIVEGGPHYVTFVGSNSASTVSSILQADFRGHYVIPAPSATVTDEFGLRERQIKGPRPTFVSIMPLIEDLSDLALDSRTAQPEIGTFRSSSVGVGTEFFGIREYLPGDGIGRINWKASARTDTLLSNEYEREHVTNIYLVVDLGTARVDALKWTMRTAASIATYLLRTRNRLGLIVLGQSTSHVRIESGRRQLIKVLARLFAGEPGGSAEPSTYLVRLLEEMPRCEILVVSALASEAIWRTVVALRRKHEHVSVITRTAKSLEADERDLVVKAALLLYSLRRRATIQQTQNAQVKVIEIPADRSVRTALAAIQERPLRH